MAECRTILNRNSAEYTVSRSRFIATAAHVESEEQANDFIKEIKAKHWDARHNVYAYSIKNGNLMRFSDDGEPQGTAGKPVLDIIKNNSVVDIAVVVTRYFGGILLGTGGLVRAYSKSAKDAVLSAETVLMRPCVKFKIECEYSDYNTLEYLLKAIDANINDSIFEAKVNVVCSMLGENEGAFLKKCEERFKNSIKITRLGEDYAPFKINL